jgi:hypothetical protein
VRREDCESAVRRLAFSLRFISRATPPFTPPPPHPPGGEPHHNSHRHPHQLVLHSGPLDHTTNWPLKGGKHTFWDGGVRVVAGVGGGLVPAKRRGSTWAGLAHSADWFRTVAEGLAKATFAKNATGPIDDDSFKNHLSYILLSYTPLIHSSHTLLSYTPLIHTLLIHSSHTLLSYTLLIHSSHTLLSYTPLIHSSHTLLSYTPLIYPLC